MDARPTEAQGRGVARLRGHHFMCQQVYHGQGRSAAFAENLRRVVAAASDAPALIVAGADDLCVACACLDSENMCRDPHAGEPEISRLDDLALELLGAAVGSTMTLEDARGRLVERPEAVRQWRETACSACAGERLCARGWERV